MSHELINVLSVTHNNIDSSKLLVYMWDRVSMDNIMVVHILKIVYPRLLDVGCLSRTLDWINF